MNLELGNILNKLIKTNTNKSNQHTTPAAWQTDPVKN